MEREDDPVVVVDERRVDLVLYGVRFLIEVSLKVGDLQRLAILVFALVGDSARLGLPDPGTVDILSAQREIERVAHRLDLPEGIQAIGFGELFGDGRVHLRPGSSRKDRHPKKNQNDQPAQHPSALLGEQTTAILPIKTTISAFILVGTRKLARPTERGRGRN